MNICDDSVHGAFCNFIYIRIILRIATLAYAVLHRYLIVHVQEFPAKNAWSLHDERMLRHKVHRRFLHGTTSRSMTGIVLCFVLPSTVICCALFLFRRICNRIDMRVIETHTTPDQGHVSCDRPTDQYRLGLWTRSYIVYWYCDIQMPYFLKYFFAQKSLMKSTLRHHHAGYI
jgi:hypothetical protein